MIISPLTAIPISVITIALSVFNIGLDRGWFDRPLNRLWAWLEARKERKNS